MKTVQPITVTDLIRQLTNIEPDERIEEISSHVISYAGEYGDLAIEPSREGTTAGELFDALRDAVGTKMFGRLVGDFIVAPTALVHVAGYGQVGPVITSIEGGQLAVFQSADR